MDTAEPLVLPTSPAPAERPPLPLLAALVPVAAGIVMWIVTGSLLALCFAALGPLMMLASLVDGSRRRRREIRRIEADAARQWDRAEATLARRKAAVRAQLRRRIPDTRASLERTPLGEEAFGSGTMLVVGNGETASGIRVTGGEDERAERFRARAAVVEDAPIAVPVGGGVCVRGPAPLADAVARALLVQLCRRFRAAGLALRGEGAEALGLVGLPHARSRAPRTLAVAVGTPPDEADAALCVVAPGQEVPAGITTVVDCEEPLRVRVRGSDGGELSVVPDVLSRAQAELLASTWDDPQTAGSEIPERLALSELPEPRDAPALAAVFARGERGDLTMDLVADGPHAIVTGMTGAGKSELLISWVLSLAVAHGPERVHFVLADFKGGTAFDPLHRLPHVAAVITDLDGDGARRGVQSLRAELRRREEVLSRAGARDVSDPAVTLARLVIVVDEFAALLHEHPGLGEVFVDIAARGRALGMHLILGTQRAAGVVRDALAANCPLRVSLRVTDAADSRAVVGVPDAAELPGDAASRGLAVIRRPQDAEAHLARIALSGPEDIARVARRWERSAPATSPWLPALPTRIARAELTAPEGEWLLGLVDEPSRQRQRVATLRPGCDRGLAVFGGPQSGKTTLVEALVAQEPAAVRLSADPERLWDQVIALTDTGERMPPLILIDDADALLTTLPADYSHACAERFERLLRRASADAATVVLTAARPTGAVLRLAELLPRRALLAFPSRAEHLAAGGGAESFLAGRPPGRAHLDGVELQFAVGPAVTAPADGSPLVPWIPTGLSAVVTAQPRRLVAELTARHPAATVLRAEEWAAREESAGDPLVIVDDGEGWQRHWALWQRLRAGAEVLVAAECPGELRTLLGTRELPPFARTHRGRAWSFREGVCTGRVWFGGGVEPGP